MSNRSSGKTRNVHSPNHYELSLVAKPYLTSSSEFLQNAAILPEISKWSGRNGVVPLSVLDLENSNRGPSKSLAVQPRENSNTLAVSNLIKHEKAIPRNGKRDFIYIYKHLMELI